VSLQDRLRAAAREINAWADGQPIPDLGVADEPTSRRTPRRWPLALGAAAVFCATAAVTVVLAVRDSDPTRPVEVRVAASSSAPPETRVDEGTTASSGTTAPAVPTTSHATVSSETTAPAVPTASHASVAASPTSAPGPAPPTTRDFFDGRQVVIGDDPCFGEPPFALTLPADFDPQLVMFGLDIDPSERFFEPYHPNYSYQSQDGRGLDLFHGNSWRLTVEPIGETQVLGRRATLGRQRALAGHDPIIEFVTTDSTDNGCDYWAIRGVGLTSDELLDIAHSLVMA
jgi:hypothetical protein